MVCHSLGQSLLFFLFLWILQKLRFLKGLNLIILYVGGMEVPHEMYTSFGRKIANWVSAGPRIGIYPLLPDNLGQVATIWISGFYLVKEESTYLC